MSHLILNESENRIYQKILETVLQQLTSTVKEEITPALQQIIANEESILDISEPSLQNRSTITSNAFVTLKSDFDFINRRVKTIEENSKELNERHAVLSNTIDRLEQSVSDYTSVQIKKCSPPSHLQKQIDDLRNSNPHTAEILQEQIDEVEKSHTFLSTAYEALRKKVEHADKANNELSTKLKIVQTDLGETKARSMDNSKYSRRDSIEICGIPLKKKEDLKQVVVDICKKMNLVMTKGRISTAHRLKVSDKYKGHPPVIVKFAFRDSRNEVFDLRNTAKDINRSKEWGIHNIRSLFINESLTFEKKKLFRDLKRYTKENNISLYVWPYHGNIYVREKTNNAPRIQIDSLQDLKDLQSGRRAADTSASTVPK